MGCALVAYVILVAGHAAPRSSPPTVILGIGLGLGLSSLANLVVGAVHARRPASPPA